MDKTSRAALAHFLIPLFMLLCLPAAAADISPSLARQLRMSGPGERLAVWVFFRDRGDLDPAELEMEIAEAASRLTPDAAERRHRARGRRPFDQRDLPLRREYVDEVGRAGVEFRAFSRWLNAASVWAAPEQVYRLADLDFVDRLSPVSGLRGGPAPLAAPSLPREGPLAGDYGQSQTQLELIEVPMLHGEGYTGAGIKVAVFDTGFWLEHEAFADLDVFAEWDFINDDPVTENEPGDLEEQHYHGTMCLSLIGGNAPGSLMGPAYNAVYILAKTEDMSQEAPVEEDWWIEAAEWADSLGARIISSSLCYNDWYTYEDMDGNTAPITVAADNAVENGIVVVNAAGNSGSSDWKYILAPADGDLVISVGSVDSTGVRSYWSSQGPTSDGRIKPTVMAMGQADYIADPAGGATAYRRGSGTSFATPLVAGAVALMLERNPAWCPQDVIDAVMNTSTMASSPDTLYGYGILSAHAASLYPEAGAAPLPESCMRVYPNPARGEFILRHPPGAGAARLIDVAGRTVGTFPLSPDGLTRIDPGAAGGPPARGVYFIEAGAAGTSKVVILE